MRARIGVAYVVPTLETGGAETQVIRLINALDRTRFRPALVCPFGFGPLKSRLDPEIEAVSLDISDRRYAPMPAVRTVTGLASALRRLKPDIIHAYLMPAYVPSAIAAWWRRPPVLIASRRNLDTHRRRSSLALRAAARAANRRIDLHLCNSEAVREAVIAEEGIARSATEVIYNGIELRPDQPQPARRAAGENDGCAAVVANFSANKRHTDVLEAAALIVRRRPGFRLTLYGDGSERPAIERQIHDTGLEGNVELAGARPDAADLLGGYDLTILASAGEGFPNALLESMARGVPVVATRTGGVPELVHDGVDGMLVDVGRPDQLASAVLELLDAPALARKMGESGRLRVAESFSTAAMVQRTEALYTRLASAVTRG